MTCQQKQNATSRRPVTSKSTLSISSLITPVLIYGNLGRVLGISHPPPIDPPAMSRRWASLRSAAGLKWEHNIIQRHQELSLTYLIGCIYDCLCFVGMQMS